MVRVLISMKHFCGYCSTVRSNIAIDRGLTEEKLLATMNFENSGLFDEREKAALRFATLFKDSDDGIDSDRVYDDLKKHFSEEEIIELALLCAQTDGVGKFARSLKMRTWEEACELQPKLRAHKPEAHLKPVETSAKA
jgi:alkylhydroperoxidase family enzyme